MLELDAARLAGEVRLEPAAPVGATPALGAAGKGADADGGEGEAAADGEGGGKPLLFPHLYGPIDLAAVARELRVTRGADGEFLAIEGLP